ncbi:MAG: FAD-binding oxidoreductase [Desulfobacteraceae bacterium]|nr:FAD-binding oxidoreductase [Desulfobacteraceae bacterium]
MKTKQKSKLSYKWMDKVPEKGSFRSIFKWGKGDEFKHPSQGFLQVIKQELNLTDSNFKTAEKLGNEKVANDKPVNISSKIAEQLKKIVGQDNFFCDTYHRLKYSKGKSMEDILYLRENIVDKISDLVLHPKDKADVLKIVALCHQKKIPIHVYGGGSSVTLGLDSPKGGVTLVMSTHMNQMIDFCEENQTITVQAGMLGPDYEELLNLAPEILDAGHRYTGGHFPQSFEHSTVGGWIVTLGSGQASSYFGDAYDLVISQEYVTPTGHFTTLDYPGTATGPKVNDILKGSEGCFGVLVGVTMKIFKYLPENTKEFTFMFSDFESTVKAAKAISQSEFGMPSILRISDPEETDVALKMFGLSDSFFARFMGFKKLKPGQRCLMMGQADGEKKFAKNVHHQIKKICKQHNGIYLSGYPMKKWRKGRFSDPYMRDALNDYGVLIDTLETAVTWENLSELYENVRAYIKKQPNTICMTHASHFYAQGTNLYFIFITPADTIETFKKFQRGIIASIEKNKGSLSHHHGIGRMMAPFLETHLGKEQMDVLRTLKIHFDPHNIMNPGGLGL